MRLSNHLHLYRSRFSHHLLFGFVLLFTLFLTSCNNKDKVTLNFAFGPDDSGTVQSLIDEFNKAEKGNIEVVYQEGSRLSNEFYREIEKDFEADEPGMDVIGADVVWTSALAHRGWVDDLSSRFYDNYNTKDFIDASLNSTIYQFKIWGIPWYTDAGILYYRKDLLEKSGYNQPPTTWAELREMAKKVMADSGTKHGYVFQGANYEGGVTNACEYIWNAGGDILIGDLSAGSSFDQAASDVNIITVNSEDAKEGLNDAHLMVSEGVAPSNIHEFKELEAVQAFGNGDAVFMRNWPTAYPRFAQEDSKVKAGQIELAALPVSSSGDKSYSCLGGWNLMVNSRISPEKKAAAWKFIRFMTDQAQQRTMALKGGTLPSLRSLYEDEALMKEAPVIGLAKKVIRNTRVRPITPEYMSISPDIGWTFSQVLQGQLNPTEAVETIQGQIERVLTASR